MIVALTHIVLYHRASLETVLLRGPTREVAALADRIIAERGVRFGAVNVVSVDANDDHAAPNSHHHVGQIHAYPPRG